MVFHINHEARFYMFRGAITAKGKDTDVYGKAHCYSQCY